MIYLPQAELLKAQNDMNTQLQQPFPPKEVIELNDEIMKNGFDECLNQVFSFAPKIRCVLLEKRRLFLHDLEASVNPLCYA